MYYLLLPDLESRTATIRALAEHGPCIHHRRTFARVKAMLEPEAAVGAEPLLFDPAVAA